MSTNKTYDSGTLLDFIHARLPEDAMQDISRACAQDPSLAAEVAMMRGVISAQAEAAEAASATEFGWARLARAIDQRQQAGAGQAAVRRKRFAPWQVAASAVAAIALWQTLAVPLQSRQDSDGAAYVPASTEDLADLEAKILFREGTTEAEMRDLLQELGASVSAGPSALGFWTITFDTVEDRTAAIAALEDRDSPVEIIHTD